MFFMTFKGQKKAGGADPNGGGTTGNISYLIFSFYNVCFVKSVGETEPNVNWPTVTSVTKISIPITVVIHYFAWYTYFRNRC